MKKYPALSVNFPKEWIPVIWDAIIDKKVEWGKTNLFASSCSAEFRWAGADWHYEESFERPVSITLIKGNPDSQDLTAAVLKGKIEPS